MYCKKCSNIIPNSSVRCPFCGFRTNSYNHENAEQFKKESRSAKFAAVIFGIVSALTLLIYTAVIPGAINRSASGNTFDLFSLFKSTALEYNYQRFISSSTNVQTLDQYRTYRDEIMHHTSRGNTAYYEKFITAAILTLLILGLYKTYKVLTSYRKSFFLQKISASANIVTAVSLLTVAAVVKWDFYLASTPALFDKFITFSPILIFYFFLGVAEHFVIRKHMHQFGITLSDRVEESSGSKASSLILPKKDIW